jgi:hypothetical protein
MTLDIKTEQDRISDTLEAAAIRQGPVSGRPRIRLRLA